MFNNISILRTFNVGNLENALMNKFRDANLNNVKINIGNYNSFAEASIAFKSNCDDLCEFTYV